jgi:hypothetical protein
MGARLGRPAFATGLGARRASRRRASPCSRAAPDGRDVDPRTHALSLPARPCRNSSDNRRTRPLAGNSPARSRYEGGHRRSRGSQGSVPCQTRRQAVLPAAFTDAGELLRGQGVRQGGRGDRPRPPRLLPARKCRSTGAANRRCWRAQRVPAPCQALTLPLLLRPRAGDAHPVTCPPEGTVTPLGCTSRPITPEGVEDAASAVSGRGASLCGQRGRGSAGRAQPCQGWGRGFESRRPLPKAQVRRPFLGAPPRVGTHLSRVYRAVGPGGQLRGPGTCLTLRLR